MNKLPRLIITPGEPGGIGPDIAISLAQHAIDAQMVFVVDPDLVRERAVLLGRNIEIVEWDGEVTKHRPGTMTVLAVKLSVQAHCGKLDHHNAQYVLDTLKVATDNCLQRRFDALVTGPIQKSIINDAGIPFSGHTEFLAERCNVDLPVMMLATEGLRVALVTTHLPLVEVPKHITEERVRRVLSILHRDMQTKFGINNPRILVCGLNPHAGENGHLGKEEQLAIEPAIRILQQQGMDIVGPLPADTLYTPANLADADATLAMFHDQGLPVLKYAGFGNAINITLGLPIIRTSVDHGTALGLAGSGKAHAGSLILATNTAIDMVNTQQ